MKGCVNNARLCFKLRIFCTVIIVFTLICPWTCYYSKGPTNKRRLVKNWKLIWSIWIRLWLKLFCFQHSIDVYYLCTSPSCSSKTSHAPISSASSFIHDGLRFWWETIISPSFWCCILLPNSLHLGTDGAVKLRSWCMCIKNVLNSEYSNWLLLQAYS